MPSWQAQGQLHLEVWKFQQFIVTKEKFSVSSPFVDNQRAIELSAVWQQYTLIQ